MRVVFMGTPSFAVPSLLALAAAHQVVAVYTRPDKPAGRGREPRPSAVKQAAHALGVPVHQPESLRDPSVVEELRALDPDVICVAAYGLILPQPVLDIARIGCVNVHASLLPRWRGAAPVQRSILAGDAATGVSIMRMEAGLDTGPVARVLETPVEGHTAETLTALLAILGARALLDTLADAASGILEWTPQPEEGVTYADKVSKADVALRPDLTAEEALRRVRASTPQAPSRSRIAGTGVTVLRAAADELDRPAEPGGVVPGKRELLLGLADAAVVVQELKPDGRGVMDGASFARGARLAEDSRWEAE